MRAGRLSRLVSVQRRIETQTDRGQTIWTWEEVCQAWAEISGVTGREGQGGAPQVQAVATHNILLRYRSDIVAKMRVVELGCPDVAYDIQVPLANARRTELRLLCVTRDAEGWRE